MASNPVKLTIQATDTDGIAQSQNPAGAGDLTLNGVLVSGGVATLSAAHILTLACTSNETGETWTVYGTDADGNSISEAVAGVNNTSTNTTKYFKTVTQITVTAAATGMTVGHTSTNGCVSQSIKLSPPRHGKKVSWQVNIPTGGTATYTVQHTLMQTPGAVWNSNASYTGLTANSDGYYLAPVRSIRLQSTAMSSSIELHPFETEE